MDNHMVISGGDVSSEKIKKITESILGLPTLPTVVAKMITLVDNPKTSATSLARLIASDQALTAKVLKLANSAYYGFSREISTVNMAIVILGFNTVRDMGLSLSVFDAFKSENRNRKFDLNKFWEHSIASGIAARMLARKYLPNSAGEAFVSGLLHDIGKVILNQYFQMQFLKIISLQENGIPFEDAEDAVIHTPHAQIGAWLAKKWNLPKIIEDALFFHHHPWNSQKNQLFNALICYADYVCHISGFNQSGRLQIKEPDERLWNIFDQENVPLGKDDCTAILDEFMLEYDKSEPFITALYSE